MKPLDTLSILENLEFLPSRKAKNRLCSRCKRLNLRDIFEHGITGSPERGISLGWSDRIIRNIGCPFCRLLASIASVGSEEVEFWTLVSLDSREASYQRNRYFMSKNHADSLHSRTPGAIYLTVVRTRTYDPYGVEWWMRRARLPYRAEQSPGTISLLASLAPPNRRDFSGRIISQGANLSLIKSLDRTL